MSWKHDALIGGFEMPKQLDIKILLNQMEKADRPRLRTIKQKEAIYNDRNI